MEWVNLQNLENGDVFVALSDTKKKVYGNPMFNRRHGSATRNCHSFSNGIVSKSCRLKVVKVGESAHKAKIMQLFGKKDSSKLSAQKTTP